VLTNTRRRIIAACASVLLLLGVASWTSSPAAAGSGDGTISGKVTGPTGTPLDTILVTVFQQDGDVWTKVPQEIYTFYDNYGDAPSKIGTYTATLAPGTYKLAFHLPRENQYFTTEFAPEYYNDAQTLAAAEPITITAGQARTGVNAQLGYSGGTISGTITDVVGTPLSFVEVYGYEATNEFEDGLSVIERGPSFQTYTDVSGHYSLRTHGVPVKVRFLQDSGGYFAEFFDDHPQWVDAPFLDAQPGVDLAGTDAELASAPLVNQNVPQISGNLYVGGTVKAWHGDWSTITASYTYEWFRAGTSTPIATGPTYKVSSTSVGKKLTVTVTAHQAGTPEVPATSLASAAVKRASYITLAGSSPSKGKVKLNVTLKFTGISHPSGKAKVSCNLGSHPFKSKTISISKGKGTVTFTSMPKRSWPCKAVFTATSTAAGDTATKTIKVKK
jgi:hypothetical protein